MRIFRKDPRETLDFTLGWINHLTTDDRIVSVRHSVPSGLHLISENNTDDKATCWTSEGVLGATYEIGCQVSTKYGRILYRSYLVEMVVK